MKEQFTHENDECVFSVTPDTINPCTLSSQSVISDCETIQSWTIEKTSEEKGLGIEMGIEMWVGVEREEAEMFEKWHA